MTDLCPWRNLIRDLLTGLQHGGSVELGTWRPQGHSWSILEMVTLVLMSMLENVLQDPLVQVFLWLGAV